MTNPSNEPLAIGRTLQFPVLPPSAPAWARGFVDAIRAQHNQVANALETLARHRTLVGTEAQIPGSKGTGVLYATTDTQKLFVDLDGGWIELTTDIRTTDDDTIEITTSRGTFGITGGSGTSTDTYAIHDNVANEINPLNVKHTPVDNDIILIEDSQSGYSKKKLLMSDLPGGDGDCPEYKFIKATGQSEGDLHLSDGTNWNTSNALIKKIRIETASTDWDAWLLQNDNGYSTDDANIPAMQIMDAGSGDLDIDLDHAYEDEDTSSEVHLYLIDNSGTATFDVYVIGYGLSTA